MSESNSRKQITLTWELGHHAEPDALPAEWIPAQVPGAVQLDWARAKEWPPYWHGGNFRQYTWMEDVYWTYRTRIQSPKLASGERVFFACGGVDYQFEIRLSGELLHAQEGMFTPVRIDLTARAGSEEILEVRVFPAPKRHPIPVRSQADQSCKPAVSYGWDWHPRLIPLGIWRETHLEIVPATAIETAEVAYCLNEERTTAELTLNAQLSGSGKYRWRVMDPEGQVLLDQTGGVTPQLALSATLDKIQLWWPNGFGPQPLYRSRFELVGDGCATDSVEQRIGFRTIELVMNEGAWDEPKDFPKSRSVAPITAQVNGQRIFIKGSNWVPPEIFPGTFTRERFGDLLGKARHAHLNMLRVWGGGYVNQESFFDLADEMGLLIWQEFPLACNDYQGTPKYLAVLEQEAVSIVRRLRSRACLALWCGGNELFNAWSGMTDQSAALRLLNAVCYRLDPKTPFLPTAPVIGMGHGPYGFQDPNTKAEIFTTMAAARNTAYSECSSTGPANAEVIRGCIPEEQLFPPARGSAWEDHHAYGAWDAEPESHLLQPMLERYFGKATSLEVLVANGQWIQNEGIKCLFEEARRQKPYCSMVLNWCYNEPWPCAAGGSTISWPSVPKPAYEHMKAACRPILASAQMKKFVWTEGECIEVPLWLLNDTLEAVGPCRVHVWLEGETQIRVMTWDCPGAKPNGSTPGPVARAIVPGWECDRFTIHLRVEGKPEWDSTYTLVYRKSDAQHQSATRGMNV